MNVMMCPLTPSDVRMEQRRQSHDFIREGRVEHSDRILAMKQQEDTKYCYAIYLSHSSSLIEDKLSIRSAIDPLMRERICLWTFRVVDHCNFSRQIAERSVSYFDRCLASCGKVLLSEQTTWLTGVVALYLAIKIHHSATIGVHTIVELSRNQFSAQQIIAMESFMVRTLFWYLHPPTASEFAYSIISLLPEDVPMKKDIYDWSKFVLYSSVCNAFFVPYRTSSVALAAVMNVMEDMNLLHHGDDSMFGNNCNRLHSFFEEDIALDLLFLGKKSEELKIVELLRVKLKEITQVSTGYAPPIVNTFKY